MLTLGNHTWSQREMETVLKDDSLPILRPLNYPSGVPGRGFLDLHVRGTRVRVVSLMGRVFMGESLDDAVSRCGRSSTDDAGRCDQFSLISMPRRRVKKWRWGGTSMGA